MKEDFEVPSFSAGAPVDEPSRRLLDEVMTRQFMCSQGGWQPADESFLPPMSAEDFDREDALTAARILKRIIPKGEEGITQEEIATLLRDRSLGIRETRALQWLFQNYDELKTRWTHGVYWPTGGSRITPQSFKDYGQRHFQPKL